MFKPDQVYVVHGVNDFDEAAVLATIRDRYGFEKLEAFNWDRTTPSVFPKGNPLMFHFRPFAEIGHGFIRGAHIGFFPPTDN